MKKNYKTATDAATICVPNSVNVVMTDLADELREGLLALAVGTGLQVMDAILEESVIALCGPKGRHDPNREAVRHGHEDGSVALGGRKVSVRRPRVRSADNARELEIPAYEHFSSTEVLGKLAMEKMLAKLSTRRYHLGLEPVGERVETVSSGKSRSAVSRRFAARTEHALAELLVSDLSKLDLRYGRLFDETVRVDYERALTLAKGRLGAVLPEATPVALETDWRKAPLIKSRLSGGYCVRTLAQGACTYTNICEHCPNFRSDATFLPTLLTQRVDAADLLADAEARGWGEEAARHRRLIDRLDKLVAEAEAKSA